MSTEARPAAGPDRRSRALLVFGAVAVAFAAVDTYVVVLALPDMMASVGIGVDQLQRAAPIVSGFLLGYVAMLPLIGRIADLRGPVPVLAASLGTFALGSLVTAVAYDLPSIVGGRFLQGLGGGGLVPATIALVATLYPVERRGLPLGLVSAVQEFGSVLGPLFGAAVLAFTSWRGIFAINLAAGLLLLAVVRTLRGPQEQAEASVRRPGRTDWLGAIALVVVLGAGLVTFVRPASLMRDLTWGQLFIPVVSGGGRWLYPIGLVTLGALVVLLLRLALARRPLLDVRGWGRSLLDADLVGALALGAVLAGIVLAFATADPEEAVFSPQGPWFLAASAIAAVLLVVHLRRADAPLVPRGALRHRAAWGSLVVSLLVGWALIAALVDVPLFARTTIEDSSQLEAALWLLRFLAALPVGAVVGGWLVRRVPAGVITAVGMLLAAASFQWMAGWGMDTLDSQLASVPLVLGGLGFGLALAPVNAAVLATTPPGTHGIASALVVVARMVGMLVGISVLTTWGLRRLYEEEAANPGLSTRELGVLQEQAVFQGAAVFALAAAVLALVLLRGAPTREVDTAEVLRSVG